MAKCEVNGVMYKSRPEPSSGDGCAGCSAKFGTHLCDALPMCVGIVWVKRAEHKVKVVFTFKPGTEDVAGKTERLLRLGIQHCMELEPATFEALEHYEIKEK